MKRVLSILAAVGLTATTSASVAACSKKGDDNNGGNDNGKCEKKTFGDWESRCPSDNPFQQVDNKWYFAVYESHGGASAGYFNINKFKYRELGRPAYIVKTFTNPKSNPTITIKSVYQYQGNEQDPTTPEININNGEFIEK